jgi:hypothetical protein
MMPENSAHYRRTCFQAGANACAARTSLEQEFPLLPSRFGQERGGEPSEPE